MRYSLTLTKNMEKIDDPFRLHFNVLVADSSKILVESGPEIEIFSGFFHDSSKLKNYTCGIIFK